MNALSTALAMNDFLFMVTGLLQASELTPRWYYFRTRTFGEETAHAGDRSCPECAGRKAKGDSARLPVKLSTTSRPGTGLAENRPRIGIRAAAPQGLSRSAADPRRYGPGYGRASRNGECGRPSDLAGRERTVNHRRLPRDPAPGPRPTLGARPRRHPPPGPRRQSPPCRWCSRPTSSPRCSGSGGAPSTKPSPGQHPGREAHRSEGAMIATAC